MGKHREVKKWVAMIEHPIKGKPFLVVEEVTVIETSRQLRLKKDGTKQYRAALRACCMRTTFEKKRQKQSPCNLFDTRDEALRALEAYYNKRVSDAEASLQWAKRDKLLLAGMLYEGDDNED